MVVDAGTDSETAAAAATPTEVCCTTPYLAAAAVGKKVVENYIDVQYGDLIAFRWQGKGMGWEIGTVRSRIPRRKQERRTFNKTAVTTTQVNER